QAPVTQRASSQWNSRSAGSHSTTSTGASSGVSPRAASSGVSPRAASLGISPRAAMSLGPVAVVAGLAGGADLADQRADRGLVAHRLGGAGGGLAQPGQLGGEILAIGEDLRPGGGALRAEIAA